MNSSMDQPFLADIKKLVGLNEELIFERRGSTELSYEFHGKLVGLDEIQNRIAIYRTRSHAGETHWMGLKYFLRVTRPNGNTIFNEYTVERDMLYRHKQDERAAEILKVLQTPGYSPSTNVSQSMEVGRRGVEFDGNLLNLYVFCDRGENNNRTSFYSSSRQDAKYFMSLQDLYLTLNDMLPHAIRTRFIWPSWIQLKRKTNPAFWSIDWLDVCDQFADVPHSVLDYYLRRVLNKTVKSFSIGKLTNNEVKLLLHKGLIILESDPTTPEDILNRVQMLGLRSLMFKIDPRPQYLKRDQLVNKLLTVMSPDLLAQAKQLMRAPKLSIGAPKGLDIDAFRDLLDQLRTMMYMQRQWLRDTRDSYSEQEIASLTKLEKKKYSNCLFAI